MIIETDHLCKSFGRVYAVRDLCLRVPQGGVTAFLGPNGHGKTTTMKMLLGMMHPSAGSGRVLGFDIADSEGSLKIRRRTGFVSEDKGLYGYMTAEELIAFTRRFYPQWRRDREKCLLTDFEVPLRRPIKQMSKGMRTKLALVLALARGADLLILDEPSEGLDPVMTEIMLQAVIHAAADGATVFFSSHQLSEAERVADHVFILNRGAVAMEGALEELRERYRRINVVFATAFPPLEKLRHLIQARRDGNVLTALTNEHADAVAAEMKSLGAVTVEAHPVGLRELFLESVKEKLDVA